MGKGGGGGLATNIKGAARIHQQWTGVDEQAQAAGGAARAAEAEARASRDAMIGEGRRVEKEAMDLSQASPSELRAYEATLTSALKQNDQDQRLIDSIDPALLEASSQVLKLLKGEQSGAGNVIGNQRGKQREQLLAKLRAQLGPGAESSAMGLKALRDFDAQSAELGASTQGQSIATLMGVLNTRPNANGSVSNLSQAGANYGNISSRLAGTKIAAGGNLMNAMNIGNQGVANTVGSAYTEQLIRGRGMQQDHKTGAELIGSIWGGKSGGGGGG